MKKTLLLLLAFASIIAQAQIPSGYYDNATGKTGDDLKIALHNIIKGHHQVSYAGLLDAYAYTDCKANGKIWDIYSNYEFSLSSTCGSYQKEGDCWNREHTWPQSWFNEQSIPRSDLFHVYPTDGYVNNRRSSYPYGEVNNPTYTSGNGSKLGPCVTTGYSGTVFEPINEYKGDIARSYFYMSVRYYSEDSSWDNTDMTEKSVIKPWAMTMLLRWSDEDPVSDKEIARNNAVYGYQNNRNPFIDHPEYARMIWDPNYTPVTTYAITCASVSNGSVSASHSSAAQGTIVQLTATPAPGYTLDSWNVYKTGASSTHITVTNNSFVMPDYPVTVSASFKTDNTYYNIALGNVSYGSIGTTGNVNSAKSGTTINLTATPNSGYSLYSWYVYKTGDMNTTVTVTNPNSNSASFTMPSYNVTVTATFVQSSGGSGDYVKVTSTPSDWSGEYILVYENTATQGYVWTGVDATNCYNSKTISSSTIAYDNNLVTITIAPMSGGYSVKVNGGTNNNKYISGSSSSNTISFGNSASTNTFSIESNSVKMVSNTSVMRFNSTDGNRFRYYKSGTYTQQQPIQLYKKTSSATTPTHTIHFNKNGGSGTMSNQTVNEFEPTALNNNAFTRTGFIFNGWNTAANGTGTYYADGATVTLLEDLTLYAQWDPLFSVTCATGLTGGSISATPTSALEGATITLTATPASGYELDHWTVTDASDNSIVVIENQFEMPAANVNVSATFVYVGQPFEQKYYLVTSSNQLVAGRTYLIVNTANQKALGTTQNNNNRSGAGVTISSNTIASIGSDVCTLTLGKENGKWTFFDADYGTNGGYLYAASSSNNYLKTQTENDDNGRWSISITSAGVATITAQGTNTRKYLKYNPNNGSPIFSCYGSASDQQNVSLFILSEETDHTTDETIAQIFSFDKHVIRSGTTLTVTGTATCNDPSHLIIEEGGQLIHHSDGVQATVKRTIKAYTADDNGWYTVATPFITTYNPANTPLTTNDYDLFAYDESATGAEWRNYKAASFNLATGHGYLYAHNPTTTLRMTGTLNNGDYSNTIDLGYDNNNADIRGFNLLGNPTTHDINFTKTDHVSDGYYYVENGSSLTYVASNTVPAGRGFFVKANAANQSVTLNSNSKRDNSETIASLLQIDVDGEQAYVKLTEGVSMPLLDFRGHHSNVYLTKEGKNYIMLVRDNADAIDLCYQPSPGTHTLSVKAENLEYLHLIDHLTGNNIDLLANPSYSFESGVKDYTSRFQLVFSPKTYDDVYGDSFVDGKTVIIDLTGRVVATDRNAKLAPGIYLLRTVNGNEVKTKKVLIN